MHILQFSICNLFALKCIDHFNCTSFISIRQIVWEKSRANYIKYTNLSSIHVFDAYDLRMESDVV